MHVQIFGSMSLPQQYCKPRMQGMHPQAKVAPDVTVGWPGLWAS